MEEFLTELERALTGTAVEKAEMVGVLRAFLEDAAERGALDQTLEVMGSPSSVAARMLEGGSRRHRHLDQVVLPDGTEVWAVSYRADHARDRRPDFGLYLDERWQPPWSHEHVNWPDFGLPRDRLAFTDGLAALLSRARQGELVELGCLGGHGRTGTALACLAVIAGLDSDPVQWVRSAYCERAVETDEQAEFVRSFRAEAS